MWVSTFHSACVRILRKEIDKFGYKSSFSIYDAADSKRLMTLVLRDLDLDPKRYQPRAVLNWVSNAKNELVDHEDAGRERQEPPRGDLRLGLHAVPAAAARGQRARLRRPDHDHGAPVPGVPRGPGDLPRRFRHVLVDEYQDTNHAQYALIRELCGHVGARARHRAPRASSLPS